MKKFISIFTKWMSGFSYISAILLLLMAVLVCIHIVMRGFFNSGLPGIYEIVQYLMLTIVAFSLAENELTAGSITTTFLLDKMKPRTANIIQIVMYCITACGMAYVFFNQTKMVVQKLSNGAASDVLNIPHWIIVMVVCVGLLFYTIAYIIRIYMLIDNHKNLTDEKMTNDEKAAHLVSTSDF